jgi:hypothetical protein
MSIDTSTHIHVQKAFMCFEGAVAADPQNVDAANALEMAREDLENARKSGQVAGSELVQTA